MHARALQFDSLTPFFIHRKKVSHAISFVVEAKYAHVKSEYESTFSAEVRRGHK